MKNYEDELFSTYEKLRNRYLSASGNYLFLLEKRMELKIYSDKPDELWNEITQLENEIYEFIKDNMKEAWATRLISEANFIFKDFSNNLHRIIFFGETK